MAQVSARLPGRADTLREAGDFDVFPLLQTHPPRSLRWLVHPGSSLEPEVEVGLRSLSSVRSCRVDTTSATLFDYLGRPSSRTLPAASPLDLEGAARGPRTHFTAVTRSARALGAARVLFEIGAFEELHKLAELTPCTGADVVWLAKIMVPDARPARSAAQRFLATLTAPSARLRKRP